MSNNSRTNGMLSGLTGVSGASNYVMELVIGLLAVIILYFGLGSFQLLLSYINRLEANRVNLLPYTYQMNQTMKQIVQNPNIPDVALTALPSSNEATGIEFSYSFFLNVPQQAFSTGTDSLTHIFHKGSPLQYPLLGPGVYMRSNKNILRVYMNTYDKWNNYIEVDNFPIGKWCHVVLVCKSMHLEIYINGNISSRLGFNVSPPYQNYGDIYAFMNGPFTRPASSNELPIKGVCFGQLSRLAYFNYALSYSEINTLMNQGPSSYMDTAGNGTTATTYLTDNWWTADFAH